MVYILHISDLHFVKNAASYHTEEILVQEAARKVKNVPRGKKLLIITGDFHNFLEKDYDKAEEFIKKLVSEMDIDIKQDVFVVPGNHDVGNEDALKPLLESKDPLWKKHMKSCLAMLKDGDKDYIEERLQAFRLYNKFVQNASIYDIGEGDDFPASSHVRSWRGKLNILHLNTAIIAEKNKKDDQMADVDKAASPGTWQKYFDKQIPALAIGHNSYFDLNKDQRISLALTFYLKNVSAYLCGDRHRTEKDPDHQMIRIESGHKYGEEIPNLVAAKGIADEDDKYSEVGFCWHYWDEDNDKVAVEFRKWTKNGLGHTAPAGENGEYYMRREKLVGLDRGDIFRNDKKLSDDINVDIVFCIDATWSMDPILDSLKNNVHYFYQDFQQAMGQKRKRFNQVRVRIIVFRDYLADGRHAMMVTNFFQLPQQSSNLEASILSIGPGGGGDDLEDGLEAIAYAIKSDWNKEAREKRHIIVLCSDDGTHELGFGKTSKYYPKGMAVNFEELTRWWGSRHAPGLMDEDAKRLILFAPEIESWTSIRNSWNNTIHYKSKETGLRDIDYRQILDTITNSI